MRYKLYLKAISFAEDRRCISPSQFYASHFFFLSGGKAKAENADDGCTPDSMAEKEGRPAGSNYAQKERRPAGSNYAEKE